MTLRSAMPIEPIGDFPNHTLAFSTSKSTGAVVPDFYQVIDLSTATAQSSGYYGLFLANKSNIGWKSTSATQLAAMGVDGSNNLNIAGGGAIADVNIGNASMTGSVKIPEKTVISGASGATALLQLQPNFSGMTTGAAAVQATFTFPSPRGSTAEYHGFRSDVADPLLDGSATHSSFNQGQGNSFYAQLWGAIDGGSITSISAANPAVVTVSTTQFASGGFYVQLAGITGSGWSGLNGPQVVTWISSNTFSIPVNTSGFAGSPGGTMTWNLLSSPCGYCMDMNGNILTGQRNQYFAGNGIQIVDFTNSTATQPNTEIPVFVYRAGTSPNPMAKFRSLDGPSYVHFGSGNVSDQESGLLFLDKNGTSLWEMRKSSTNHAQIYDITNSIASVDVVAGGALNLNVQALTTSGGNYVKIGALAELSPLTTTNTPTVLITGLKQNQQNNAITAQAVGSFVSWGGESSSGTFSSPANTQSGDLLVSFYGAGYTGSAWTGGRGLFQALATENFSGTNQGTRLRFGATPNGSASAAIAGYMGAGISGANTIGYVQTVPNIIAALPTCNSGTEGAHAAVTDSSINTWGSNVASGGAIHVGVYCNGSNWTIESK